MVDNLVFFNSFCKVAIRAITCLTLFISAFDTSAWAKSSSSSHVQSAQARKLSAKAMQAIDQNSASYAKSLIIQSKDPLAYKLYDWMLFTTMENPELDVDLFLRLTKFVRLNPDWPSISKIILLAENVMPQNLSNDEVIAWFSDYPPKTPMGMLHFMDAMIINGKTVQAKKVLSEWWASTLTSRDQQRTIYQQYGKFLTMDAHKDRFDNLLLNGSYDSARAMAGVIGNGYPELAEARIALANDKGGVEGCLARVPSHLQKDTGLLYERLRWRRKHDMDQGALEILHMQPPLEKLKNPDDWWKERNIMIRRMLEEKNYVTAYKLAVHHGLTSGPSYAEGQWLAGWIGLRFLEKPKDAFQKFTTMSENVSTPLSQSRAAYWSGRAASAMGKKDLAQEWYNKAVAYKTTYYGQLALAELAVRMALPKDTVGGISKGDQTEFLNNELVQAAQVFFAAGLHDLGGKFLQAFIAQQNTPKAYKYAAELSMNSGNRSEALKIAKNASSKGYFMARQSYPLVTDWTKNTNNVEVALVHGLIRQESMFDIDARSSAGAMGLMQLMPPTAKEISGKLGVAYNMNSLTQQPAYNVMLGSAYVGRLLKRYDGNYPMAIAAYNAGPGRVSEWVNLFGDPRDKSIDLIDWIELIPISETRNYVQRVLENVYVYRLRLK